MIKKITEKLDPARIEKLIDGLSYRDKLHLARKLERQIWGKRMKQILKEIDQRRKSHPVSEEDIRREIKTVREKIYGPRRR